MLNIATAYHVAKPDQLDANDATSVTIWVERHSSDCRYIKWQHTDSARDGLKEEDFMLVIMTNVQVSLMP